MRYLPYLLITIIVFLLDQLSKHYFMQLVSPEMMQQGGIAVLPIFNLVHVWNYGAAFGMGNQAPLIITMLTTGIIAILIYWLLKSVDHWEKVILAVIAGGALGNLIDRLRHGAVFDFLDFHFKGQHWPAFNVADIAISCGVVVLLFLNFCRTEKHANQTD